MAAPSSHALTQALELLLNDLNENCQGFDDEPAIDNSGGVFEQLDARAQLLESILSAFDKYVRDKIINIRAQRNVLAPVHRLPPELLQDILLCHASENHLSNLRVEDLHTEYMTPTITPPNSRNWKSMFSLTVDAITVCSRWYQLALSTPKLWSYLESRYSLGLTHTLLERSRQCPLHVSFHEGVAASKERNFIDLIGPHFHRWKTIDIASNNSQICHAINVQVAQGCSAPMLERFLARSNATVSPLPDFICLDRSPRLRELHIVNCSIPSLKIFFSSLIHLSTVCIVDALPFGMEQMELLFSSSPLLRTVFLCGPQDSPIPPKPFSITLQHLESMVLDRMDSKMAFALLLSIFPRNGSNPSLKLLESWLTSSLSFAKKTIWDSSRTGSVLDVTLRAMSWFSLTYCSLIRGFVLNAGMKVGGVRSTLLKIQSTTSSTQDALSNIGLGYISGINDMEVELRDPEEDDDTTFVTYCFRLYPHIKHLTIIAPPDEAPLLADALYYEGIQGAQIKKLTLKGPSIQDVAELLKMGWGCDEEELMSSAVLAQLEKIEVQTSSSDEDEMVGEITSYLQTWNVQLEITPPTTDVNSVCVGICKHM
ncbi:hypothetical protein FRC03_002771 [Tulasnella sp. 419]|nr:hypothetical protein FRC03_002771 [Tulasnella sp. 419]